MTTAVIFRKWRSNGDIIALFPAEVSDYQGQYCLSYMHIGQHGGAEYSLILQQTLPTKPAEYADLLKELIAIGYTDLKIYQRRTRVLYNEYLDNFHQYYKDGITS